MGHPKYPTCVHCMPNRLCRQHQIKEDQEVQERMASLKTEAGKAGIVWEEPPAPAAARREAEYGAAFDVLMQHPKRWARIREFPGLTSATTAAAAFKKGAPIRSGMWEFRAVRHGKGSRLYARYMGEE